MEAAEGHRSERHSLIAPFVEHCVEGGVTENFNKQSEQSTTSLFGAVLFVLADVATFSAQLTKFGLAETSEKLITLTRLTIVKNNLHMFFLMKKIVLLHLLSKTR